jgi:hypothetical protein
VIKLEFCFLSEVLSLELKPFDRQVNESYSPLPAVNSLSDFSSVIWPEEPYPETVISVSSTQPEQTSTDSQ